jgi:hypothetical protein
MNGQANLLVGALIALAVAISVARLWLRRRSEPSLPIQRIPLLAALQAVAGVMLFLTLFPPGVFRAGGVLVVATEGAPAIIPRAAGEIVVTLPEAGPVASAARAPDLATALRWHSDVGAVRIVGHGLEPRDRIQPGRLMTFAPPPAPAGLTDLQPPSPVATGARFSVGGGVGAGAHDGPVRAELLDPSGTVVDHKDVPAGRRFVLSGQMRTEGLALFTLRLTSGGRRLDEVTVPVEARTDPPPRVLVLAGAPGPETKYLRRWAQDAGVDVQLQAELGAGAAVGDEGAVITRDALTRVDLLVIDDRRWGSLSAAQKAAIADAVDAGMGLLLRPEGPVPAAVLREWAGLDMPLNGGGDTRPTTLPGQDSEGDEIPLTRVDLVADDPQTTVLARDAAGAPLIAWRGRGRGRIGVWTLTDSYALALSGRASQHGELWSAALSALSRPLRVTRPEIAAPAFAGGRMTICGLAAGAEVIEAGGRSAPLIIDASGGPRECAAYWPTEGGWRVVRDRSGVETPFFVHSEASSSTWARTERRAATLALAATPTTELDRSGERVPGSPWPWFLALLAALATTWWMERRRAPAL